MQMRWVGSERKAARVADRGQMATFALDPEILLDATLRGYQAHQRFGLMGVELVGDKDPSRLWIGLDGLGEMGSEVVIACVWVQCWGLQFVRWRHPNWRSTSGCHGARIRIPDVRRDRAAWATRGGDVLRLGCRSSHRCCSHVCPPQPGPEWPNTPGTPCGSAGPVRRGPRAAE